MASAAYCSLQSVLSWHLSSTATSKAKQLNKLSCQMITTTNGGKSLVKQEWWCSDSLCSTNGQTQRNSSCEGRHQSSKNPRSSYIRSIRTSTIQCITMRRTQWILSSINISCLSVQQRDKVKNGSQIWKLNRKRRSYFKKGRKYNERARAIA